MNLIVDLSESTIVSLATAICEKLNQKNEELFTQKKVCQLLGISERTFRRSKIPHFTLKERGRKYYSLPQVKEYLNR